MLSWTVILLTIAIVLLIKWIRDRSYVLKTFERMGVPGPKPSFFFGSFALYQEKGGYRGVLNYLTEKYGRICGYYSGAIPTLLVGDPELAKRIMVTDFQKFNGRLDSPLMPEDSPYEDLFTARGEKWKRLRSIASTSFTSTRMKEMFPIISHCVDDLITLLNEKCNEGKPFDLHAIYGRLTTDVISSCAFGIDTSCLKNEKSEFFVKTREVFDFFEDLPPRIKAGLPFVMMFPGLFHFIRKFSPGFLAIEAEWHLRTAKEIIERRRHSVDKNERTDYVSLMLEANRQLERDGLDISIQDPDDEHLKSQHRTESKLKLKAMTTEEMQGSLVQFLLAGHETTGSALGLTAYRLAIHPEVQDKLRKEIDDFLPDPDSRLGYSDMKKLKYLNMVMKEVLRIHPITPIATTRMCFEDYTYGDLTIPKGTTIQINMEGLHFDKELWKDPEEFIPERFDQEVEDSDCRNSAAWIPFGLGPRMCVGMRFAIMEYKMAVAMTLKHFVIKKCPETQHPCPTKTNGMFGPSKGVYVVLKRR